MGPKAKGSVKSDPVKHVIKKCPACYEYLPLRAKRCPACRTKVGDVDKLGFAAKPFDWSGYLIAVISIAVCVVFVWWAFFNE